MKTFFWGFEDPENTYFESGVKSTASNGNVLDEIEFGAACSYEFPGYFKDGLKSPSNLLTISPLFASSNIIKFSWVPSSIKFPSGENFNYLIAFDSDSMVKVEYGLSLKFSVLNKWII